MGTKEPPWSQYQEEVAAFFRDLGYDAETNTTVEGARGKHAIDVLVRLKSAGVEVMWVVECKAWANPIPKERVLTLDGVLKDVGADRGLLVAESGFQAGAFRAAEHTNITLTSLVELHEETALLSARPAAAGYLTRLEALDADCSALWNWAPEPMGAGAFDEETFMSYATTVHELCSVALPKIVEGVYPVKLYGEGRERVAHTRQELLEMLADVVPVSEAEADRLWGLAAIRAAEGQARVAELVAAVRNLILVGRASGFGQGDAGNAGVGVEEFRLALDAAVVKAEGAEVVVTTGPRISIKVLNRLFFQPASEAVAGGQSWHIDEALIEQLLLELERATQEQLFRPSHTIKGIEPT